MALLAHWVSQTGVRMGLVLDMREGLRDYVNAVSIPIHPPLEASSPHIQSKYTMLL
jgi:hypothetical protein